MDRDAIFVGVTQTSGDIGRAAWADHAQRLDLIQTGVAGIELQKDVVAAHFAGHQPAEVFLNSRGAVRPWGPIADGERHVRRLRILVSVFEEDWFCDSSRHFTAGGRAGVRQGLSFRATQLTGRPVMFRFGVVRYGGGRDGHGASQPRGLLPVRSCVSRLNGPCSVIDGKRRYSAWHR